MDCCIKYKNSFINRHGGGEMLHFVQQSPIRGGRMKEMLYLVPDKKTAASRRKQPFCHTLYY